MNLVERWFLGDRPRRRLELRMVVTITVMTAIVSAIAGLTNSF